MKKNVWMYMRNIEGQKDRGSRQEDEKTESERKREKEADR